MAELVFLRRGEEVLRFTIDRPRVVLGRGEKCDVAVPDPEVSRQHLAITLSESGASIEDLSGKGLLVAGKKLTAGPLPDGADIELGQWRAIFRQKTSNVDEAAATEIGQKTEIGQARISEPAISAQLRVRGTKESVHKLQADAFTIGKDGTNDLVLNERFISSRHLKVSRHENRFHLIDQQSTNGTWVGPVRVFECDIPLFTTVKVGDTELVFEPTSTSALAANAKGGTSYEGLIGSDGAMRALADVIDRVAPSNAAVSIFGESGTGKELVARAVHNRSTRAEKPFIPVNCAAISKELIESELFGHEKGAFTGAVRDKRGVFEQADGGTLFLDEIGDMPMGMQIKLLRAIQERQITRVGAEDPIPVSIRLVCATHQDLRRKVEQESFREDLYYRVHVIHLHVPPLRERREDILWLAERLLARECNSRGRSPRSLHRSAQQPMLDYPWPGNVRELRHVLERACVLSNQSALTAESLFEEIPDCGEDAEVEGLADHLAVCEKRYLERVLRRNEWRISDTAAALGISRKNLWEKMRRYGISSARGES
jgi:DNA-binding NtrC family response regulator/pSer/pThr/pTyr-binding forkhead associated (FHA) protein